MMPNISTPTPETPASGAAPAHRLLVLADKVGATQDISFLQPLKALIAAGSVDLQMVSEQSDWGSSKARQAFWDDHRPSTLILSRVTGARVLPFMELAREAGVPSIFHIDDDLLDVPMQLGASKYNYYHQPERLESLRKAMNGADLVYASTRALGRQLVAHGIQTQVVPGHVYASIDPAVMPEARPAEVPTFGYMGTGGHSEDLAMVLPAIERLMTEIPDLRFETFGTIAPPTVLKRFGTRYVHHAGEADYQRFLQKLGELGWWLGLAPLLDNAFNRCKADTKWLEYSFVGVPVVASDLAPYHRAWATDACLLAGGESEWFNAMALVLRAPERRRSLVAAARDKLTRSYANALLEQQLLSILDQASQLHLQSRQTRLRHGGPFSRSLTDETDKHAW
jgi:glycosyltransferase involved in cell wall biosynthesis